MSVGVCWSFLSTHTCVSSLARSLSIPVRARRRRLHHNRCVPVWTESRSIFADVLRRSGPHERTPRVGWRLKGKARGSERGARPSWQVAAALRLAQLKQPKTLFGYSSHAHWTGSSLRHSWSEGWGSQELARIYQRCTRRKPPWKMEIVSNTAELSKWDILYVVIQLSEAFKRCSDLNAHTKCNIVKNGEAQHVCTLNASAVSSLLILLLLPL